MLHELAADEALEARPAQQREELLIERAIEGGYVSHQTFLNTPTTLPSSCTWSA
jgi:hypothetical protein